MKNTNQPSQNSSNNTGIYADISSGDGLFLSSKSLTISFIVALFVALTIFYTIVYPIEFGKDPLGTGKMFGLPHLNADTTSSEIASLIENDSTTTKKTPAEDKTLSFRRDQVEIIVPANSGVEYKFILKRYGNLVYEWSSQQPLYFDFHGEPKGNTTGYFESYTIATSSEMQGSMTMPFEGNHGWYWKNTSQESVIVALKTEGHYEIVGLLH